MSEETKIQVMPLALSEGNDPNADNVFEPIEGNDPNPDNVFELIEG